MSKRAEIWEQAVKNLSATFPKALPETINKSLFIAFDKDWSSKWVNTEPPPLSVRFFFLGFWNPIIVGVKNLLSQRGYNYPALSLKGKIGYGMLALMGWTLLIGVSMMLYALIQSFI